MAQEDLIGSVEYAVLSPFFRNEDIRQAVDAAEHGGIGTVTVSSHRTKFAAILAEGKGLTINTVIGFPAGDAAIQVKKCEAQWAVDHGAKALAVTLNIGAFLECSPDFVMKEVSEILQVADGRPVTSIIETAYLNDEQKARIVEIAAGEGSNWIQLSTGVQGHESTDDDVRLIRSVLPSSVGLKTAVAHLDRQSAQGWLEFGVDRIVTPDIVGLL